MKFNIVKRLAVFAAIIAIATFTSACQSVNMSAVAAASQKGLQAALLTDDQMADMAAKGIAEMDAKHSIAPAGSKYANRLTKLTSAFKDIDGRPLNFKVYQKPEINAFAMPDGSIRIYSGLMDAMTDGQLLFVVGHEIGHVAKGHSRKRFQMAYGTSALREIVAGQGGQMGEIAASQFGDLLQAVVNAQFSQANEREADDYGLETVTKNGLPPEDAVSALEKLASLSKSQPGFIEKMLSSHPAPGARAERLRLELKGK